MNPNTGEIITATNLEYLRRTDPVLAAQFTVELDGPAEDVEKVAEAVRASYDAKKREANRRRNKAARKARRSAR